MSVAWMGKLRLGGEGQPAVWVENQKDVRSSVACPRQVLGWVWEGWGREQRMGDLQKDMDRKAAQHPKRGSRPGDPTSHTAPAPGHCACLQPRLWSPAQKEAAGQSAGAALGHFIQQIPLLFGHVSGPDVSLGALLTCWRPVSLVWAHHEDPVRTGSHHAMHH